MPGERRTLPYDARMGSGTTSQLERLDDRYVLAAGMIVATIITTAIGGDNRYGQLVLVVMQCATLLVVFHASRVSPRTMRITSAVMAVVLVATCIAIVAGERIVGPRSVGAALALAGPVVIVRRVRDHMKIDVETVAAALCIYLLAGVFFAYVFHVIDAVDGPFFHQTANPSSVDFLYFSFTTLTTLGYGDFSPAHDLGKMLSVSEALLGQLYLVSVVALLVSNIGRERVPRAREPRERRLGRRQRESDSEPDA